MHVQVTESVAQIIHDSTGGVGTLEGRRKEEEEKEGKVGFVFPFQTINSLLVARSLGLAPQLLVDLAEHGHHGHRVRVVTVQEVLNFQEDSDVTFFHDAERGRNSL